MKNKISQRVKSGLGRPVTRHNSEKFRNVSIGLAALGKLTISIIQFFLS